MATGAAVWATVLFFGGKRIVEYAARPGSSAAPDMYWPAGSRIAHPADRPALLMFLHPKCPCSRASLSNLERILSFGASRVRCTVVFVCPESVSESWRDSDLVGKCRVIAGLSVMFDDGGAEARRFGATTSGHVLMYDARGRLFFSGGLTPARGHEGDSSGMDAVRALISGATPVSVMTPVFGCPLFEPELAAGLGTGAEE
ncbi:MAG: hypothetical protein KJ057_13430 [Phycisphaerae bacterium]|nr:MAG: hypothetical protein EDS66_07735 [Planctomycetota bacterium]KAB2948536.1 MAG: hypothetical protein F9K17_06130 [Phycisphaerae bacterium]MCL4719465.1 hypothetical protein [Phycisphaerae bacterium]MCQ3921537.1 hypothetical protein [Planctomycetota bacterium]NUQ09144.1 hypothetical protein [Phycisphaerae bacterium]